jgi:hypothetical protein
MTKKLKQKDSLGSNKATEPVNIHLSVEIIDGIEEALFHFRKLLPRETRKRLNRSKLYMLILEDVLTEFNKNKNGQEARLNQIVNNWSELQSNN